MSKKILTAEDILNETDSSDDSNSSDSSAGKKVIVQTPPKQAQTPSATKKDVLTPVKVNSTRPPAYSQEEQKLTSTESNQANEVNEQPEVDNRFGNVQTSKSAPQKIQSTSGTTSNTQFFKNPAEILDEESSDEEPDFGQTRRQSYRANQSVTYKSFKAGDNLTEQQKALLNSPIANMISSPLLNKSKAFEDPDPSQEIDDAKLLRMIEQEESNEDDSNAGVSNEQKEVKSNGSMVSEEDLLNRSLQSEEADGEEALDSINFLRYSSEKMNQRFDLLEIVDKNERQFKHVAEKMMQQSSQLISVDLDNNLTQQRRLMHQKCFKKMADRFYQDGGKAQGTPQCIASLEEYIIIGSTDGSIRLYDSSEKEILSLIDKSVKGNAVISLDIKRCDKNQNIFVVCGHDKGHVTIYEVKGLVQQWDLPQQKAVGRTASSQINVDNRGNEEIEYKHRKTLDDVHKNSVIAIKFVGDLHKEIQVISSDVTGLICVTTFTDSFFFFRADTQPFLKGRLGSTYSMAPLLFVGSTFRLQTMIGLMQGGLKSQSMKELMAKQMKQEADKKDDDEVKPQIIAFGSLEEVYVCLWKPQHIPTLSVKRPAYIKSGVVPYLDWGLALTPTFRDQAYPVLAIAWGKAIQLAVFSNQKEVDKGVEYPSLQLDGFYICECESIDSVFFLSESLIFIIVNKKDVRILYTQNFTPGVFDEQFSSKNLNQKKAATEKLSDEDKQALSEFEKAKQKYAGQVSTYAEKDSGYKMVEDEIRSNDMQQYYMMTSQQAPKSNFNQSICKNFGFNITALSESQIVQRNLIHWEEYLDLIRRTSPDFLKVLKAALDIFNGKMIGLAGLPDQKEKREQLMRERMKDLLRQNINACIKEFKEGQSVSQKTLRVATEFCIRVGSIDHVFGELFKMFSDGNVEQMYFENLDVFILSGKLKTVKIPHKILEKLIRFYRQKDIQLLEQAILNLELTKYPGIEEARFICEEEQLSSAYIHVLTTIFNDEKESDSTTCLSILCSLFNIMMRAKHKKTKQDIQSLLEYMDKFGDSAFELTQSDAARMTEQKNEEDKRKEFKEQRNNKIQIEHSSTYIGYKILWIVTLFLEGKKFPQGNLSSLRWRYYVMDIVRFVTNERFMAWFMEFDPESFFAVLSKVFNDPEPADFIVNQDQFIAANQEQNPHLQHCYTHTDIIRIFEQQVDRKIASEKLSNDGNQTVNGEMLQNAFLFFLTQIARNKKIEITKSLCLKVVKQQIAFHKTLFRLPKKQLLDLFPENLARKDKDKSQNIYQHLIKKNEKDVIQILARYQTQLTPEEVTMLLEEAKSSPLFKLKIHLYQLQGDFQRCLTLFFQIKAIKSDVFAWLYEIQHTLRAQQSGEHQENEVFDNDENDLNFFDVRGIGSRITFNKMKELITRNMFDFATMDPEKTVKLCDEWFDQNYMLIAEELKENKDIQYNFLNSVLTINETQILADFNLAVLQNNKNQSVSGKFKPVLLRLIELLVEKKQKNNNKLIDFVSRNYFPIDECLAICERKGAVEACAVLYRRKGQYQKSIKLYMSTIVSLCVEKLIHTIFVEKNIKFEDPLCTNEHMQTFDNLVQQIIKICSKYGSRQTEKEMEELWMFAIKSLFEINQEVFKKKREMEESDSDSDSSADRERHEEEMQFEKFLLIRNQHFLSRMSEHVNLRSVIHFLEQCGHAMKYDDFRRTFEDKIQTELYFISILHTAIKLTQKELGVFSADLLKDCSRGFKTKVKCDSCQQSLINKFDKQDIWVMSCQHIFHARCIAKTEGTCCVCFNELDVIHSFQQLKKDKLSRSESTQSMSNTGSSTASSTTTSNSSDVGNSDDVNSIRQQREQQLKRSIDSANKQGIVKRRQETREERVLRLMNEFELSSQKLELKKQDFQL